MMIMPAARSYPIGIVISVVFIIGVYVGENLGFQEGDVTTLPSARSLGTSHAKNKELPPLSTTTTTTASLLESALASFEDVDSKSDGAGQCPIRRRCAERPNVIVFSGTWEGVLSRLNVMYALGQFAGYLCARVEIPPPSLFLDPKHNFNQTVSEDLQWEDFYDTSLIHHEDASSPQTPLITSFPKSRLVRTSSSGHRRHLRPDDRTDLFRVITDRPDQFYKHFATVRNMSLFGPPEGHTGFLWEIYGGFYNWDIWERGYPPLDLTFLQQHQLNLSNPSLLARFHRGLPLVAERLRKLEKGKGIGREDGCAYVRKPQFSVPATLRSLAHEIWHQTDNQTLVVTVHARRGDRGYMCDTSLEKLQHYFACSFRGVLEYPKNITVMFGTNEANATYLQLVGKLVQREFQNAQFVDFEALVGGLLRKKIDRGELRPGFYNNHYLFYLQECFRSIFQDDIINLEQHYRCKDCVEVVKKYPQFFR